MKPAPFAYLAATSVEQAVAALASAGGEGKIVAGGQSLMPMLNFRLVKPAVLVDINRIPGLDRIEDTATHLRIGALVRHRTMASHPLVARHLPVLHEAMRHVAHLTVRNRGTFCGSLCHADPAAEMPMIALLLGAEVAMVGPAGSRRLPVREFLVNSLTTALADDEMVVSVDLPKQVPGAGWSFAEFARRHGDYALASVSATVTRQGGQGRSVRIAAMGVGDTALRFPAAEQLLEGSAFASEDLALALRAIDEAVDPPSDLSASEEYRRHLVAQLAGNVLREAWARAEEGITA